MATGGDAGRAVGSLAPTLAYRCLRLRGGGWMTDTMRSLLQMRDLYAHLGPGNRQMLLRRLCFYLALKVLHFWGVKSPQFCPPSGGLCW